MCVSIVAFDQGHCCVNLVHISQGIQLLNRQPRLCHRTVPSLHPHLSPPFPPLSSASLLLAAGQLGSGAFVAGLRCSLSWAGVGEERRGVERGKERREEERRGFCPTGGPRGNHQKIENKHMHSCKFKKKIYIKRAEQLCPSPLFFPLHLPHLLSSPLTPSLLGAAWPGLA